MLSLRSLIYLWLVYKSIKVYCNVKFEIFNILVVYVSSYNVTFYRIADFHANIGVNEEDYWRLTFKERHNLGLPWSFIDDVYERIHSGFRPVLL